MALYADDLALVAPSPAILQRQINLVSAFCNENGLTINTDPGKSQYMLLNCSRNVTITVKAVAIERVNSATYLGVHLSSDFRGARNRVSD